MCDFIGGETKDISAARFREEVSRRGLEEYAIYHGSKYGEEKRQFFLKADLRIRMGNEGRRILMENFTESAFERRFTECLNAALKN